MYDNKKSVPVKVGDVLYEKTVTDIGRSGTDGIIKIGAFVIFVPGGKVGKEYNIRIYNVIPTCAFAEVINEDAEGEDYS